MAAMTEEEVLALFDSCSNVGRWGPDDELGTLNLITAARRLEALGSVRRGRVVALGAELRAGHSHDDPVAVELRPRYSSVDAHDDLTLRIHGFEVTHVDAPGHVFHDGRAWGGRRIDDVARADGLASGSVAPLGAHGIVTRGVLLDVAAVRGVAHLEPGDGIGIEDVETAEQRAGVTVGPGDAIVIRSGHALRAAAEGDAHDEADPHAGILPEVVAWLRARDVAVYSGDCIEVRPSGYPRVPMPLHQVGLVAMGLCILDGPDVEALARACREEGRSDFALVVAPLRIRGGTGSAVNPLAIL
jgi:kynurenine formamidase